MWAGARRVQMHCAGLELSSPRSGYQEGDSADRVVALPGMHVLDIPVVRSSAVRNAGVSALL